MLALLALMATLGATAPDLASPKRKATRPNLNKAKKLSLEPSSASPAGKQSGNIMILHWAPFSLFFPIDHSIQFLGSDLYPAQSTRPNANATRLCYNRGGRCGAINNLTIASLPDVFARNAQGQPPDHPTNHCMNESQPFMPRDPQDPTRVGPIDDNATDPIVAVIHFQSSFKLGVAADFKASDSGRTLRHTFVIPALAYSPYLREAVKAQLRGPCVDELADAFTEEFKFKFYYIEMEQPGPGKYCQADPGDFVHILWLEPTLSRNGLMHIIREENECRLVIETEAAMDKIRRIMAFFKIEMELLVPTEDEGP